MITKRLRWSTISIRTQILVLAILMLTVIVFVLSVIMTRSFTNQMYKQEDNRFQYCFSLTDNAICTMLENNRLISKGLLQDKVTRNIIRDTVLAVYYGTAWPPIMAQVAVFLGRLHCSP